MKVTQMWLLALTLVAIRPAHSANLEAALQTQETQTQASDKCERDTAISPNAEVVRGVDGDTVVVKAGRKTYSIRMLGIDTPETHYLGKSQGKWGEIAADRLKKILPVGTKVTLETGNEVCDKYGRVLAYVFKGTTNVNLQMAKEGLAVNYCIFPGIAHCEEIGNHVTAAIRAKKGMFSDEEVELPYDFRRRVSNRVHTSFIGSMKTKFVYHPEHIARIPVGERLFFGQENMIRLPYRLVD